ncbi:sensor domain-containing diguanylate cyclase [Deinococcus roseus]|uniref:Diguanylate cyclase n=1 Tax=Deinococcus roseus TaxID=392414 RepID=A0ABQ2DCD0_9DEIO|nr:sensor domain-containing diguanylate cyclase [Deinococcus roseus]GGJ53213.1 diguanylate cyclase [Deinococcus roseus]
MTESPSAPPLIQMLEHLSEGACLIDTHLKLQYWNHAAQRITGHASSDVLGGYCYDHLPHTDDVGRSVWTHNGSVMQAMQGKIVDSTVFSRHADGHRMHLDVHAIPIRDASGNVVSVIELFHEHPGPTRELEVIHDPTLKDPLTQLGTRKYLLQVLQSALADLVQHERPFGVLFMDLNDFQEFNGQHGTGVGDQMLKLIGQILLGSLRPLDTVGRWDGEEFVVVIRHAHEAQLRGLQARLHTLFSSAALTVKEQELHPQVSMGTTLALPSDTIEGLITRARHMALQRTRPGMEHLPLGWG